jgi:hypothetical protein
MPQAAAQSGSGVSPDYLTSDELILFIVRFSLRLTASQHRKGGLHRLEAAARSIAVWEVRSRLITIADNGPLFALLIFMPKLPLPASTPRLPPGTITRGTFGDTATSDNPPLEKTGGRYTFPNGGDSWLDERKQRWGLIWGLRSKRRLSQRRKSSGWLEMFNPFSRSWTHMTWTQSHCRATIESARNAPENRHRGKMAGT